MRYEHTIQQGSERLAMLRQRAVELERDLADARVSLERELGRFGGADTVLPAWGTEDGRVAAGPARDGLLGGAPADDEADPLSAGADPGDAEAMGAGATETAEGSEPVDAAGPGARTERLLRHGRLTSYQPGSPRKRKVLIAAVALAVLAIAVVVLLPGGGSWPASVAIVQREAVKACQNTNVKSEPGQVDFACAPSSRQILWVFALMTSGDNPRFADTRTGRLGLEPIAPAQGGALAWSLNLHHPYNPFNPVDSLEVAARAINNIVGGATVAGPNGKPVVEPGLESSPANCSRYTGSGALTVRQGFPRMCARPVTSAAGKAALVADIYRRWIIGASAYAARDAATLFANARNPGDPRVQAILARLPSFHL